jgi:hypothetical protein
MKSRDNAAFWSREAAADTFEPVQQNIIMRRAPVLCLNNSEK